MQALINCEIRKDEVATGKAVEDFSVKTSNCLIGCAGGSRSAGWDTEQDWRGQNQELWVSVKDSCSLRIVCSKMFHYLSEKVL